MDTRTPAELTRDARCALILEYLGGGKSDRVVRRNPEGWVSHVELCVEANFGSGAQLEMSDIAAFVADFAPLLEVEQHDINYKKLRLRPGQQASTTASEAALRLRNSFPSSAVFERAAHANFPNVGLLVAQDAIDQSEDPAMEPDDVRLLLGSAVSAAQMARRVVRPISGQRPATWCDIHYAMVHLVAEAKTKALDGGAPRIDQRTVRQLGDLTRRLIETRDDSGLAWLKARAKGTALEQTLNKAIAQHNPITVEPFGSRRGLSN